MEARIAKEYLRNGGQGWLKCELQTRNKTPQKAMRMQKFGGWDLQKRWRQKFPEWMSALDRCWYHP